MSSAGKKMEVLIMKNENEVICPVFFDGKVLRKDKNINSAFTSGFDVFRIMNKLNTKVAEGYFKEDEANYPEGLKLWINHINQTISYIRENDVELPSELEAYWNQYLSEEDIDSRYIKPVDTCQEIEDGLHDRTVGP